MQRAACSLGMVIAAVIAAPATAQQQRVGAAPEAKNMRLIGYNDLQGRSAYQPTVQKQGDRYIAYIGHHGGTPDVPKPMNSLTGQAEFNGTSIVDVTDPAKPKYLKHIPGLEGNYEDGGGQMVRVCPGASLPKGDKNKFYLLRVFGGKAHEIWDVTDPANPSIVSRIEAGKEEIRATRFRLDTLIHETLEALRPVAEENGVTIAALGPPSVVIRADRDKISRVIMNLVHNAIKFSPRGGQVQVAASGEGEGEWVTLAVRDSGPGIPAGEVDRIFDKFHQVKRNRGRGGAGSGLGLPISRQLVEMHGGRLTVESAVGQGSTFTVVLPLSAQAERAGEGSESWRAS